MIRLKNEQDRVLSLTIAGNQTTTTTGSGYRNSVIVPFDGVIARIWAKLQTAGTTNTQTTDILLNGTTIASSGTVLSFATTAQDPTYSAFTGTPVSVSQGDILTALNTAVHTTAAKDCCIEVIVQKIRSGNLASSTSTGAEANF